ncbi:hypothetical protein EDC96DRAFT_563854, partial [Choanephora cucurbitarum]
MKHIGCLESDKQQKIKDVLEELKKEARKEDPNFKVEVGKNAATLENQVRLVFQFLCVRYIQILLSMCKILTIYNRFLHLGMYRKRKAETNYVSLIDNIFMNTSILQSAAYRTIMKVNKI